MEIKKINIIGFGNVGQNLFFHLNSKVEIVNVYNRSEKKVISDILKAKLVTDFGRLSKEVDLNIITSTDTSIEAISECLPNEVAVVHTSGSVGMEVLKKFKKSGVFYPLQTFSKNRIIEMNKVPFLLESSSITFMEELIEFTKNNCSKSIYQLNSKERENIHLAAVFINNFTTLMARESSRVLNNSNIDNSILWPLLTETVNKIIDSKEIDNIQTGPAQRKDTIVIAKHIDALQDQKQKEIYEILSKRIMDLKT